MQNCNLITATPFWPRMALSAVLLLCQLELENTGCPLGHWRAAVIEGLGPAQCVCLLKRVLWKDTARITGAQINSCGSSTEPFKPWRNVPRVHDQDGQQFDEVRSLKQLLRGALFVQGDRAVVGCIFWTHPKDMKTLLSLNLKWVPAIPHSAWWPAVVKSCPFSQSDMWGFFNEDCSSRLQTLLEKGPITQTQQTPNNSARFLTVATALQLSAHA